jgi:hypothetical protein
MMQGLLPLCIGGSASNGGLEAGDLEQSESGTGREWLVPTYQIRSEPREIDYEADAWKM